MPVFSSCAYKPDIYSLPSRGLLSLPASEIFKCHKMLTRNAPVALQPSKCTIGSNAVQGVLLYCRPPARCLRARGGMRSGSRERVSHPAITIASNNCRSLGNNAGIEISS